MTTRNLLSHSMVLFLVYPASIDLSGHFSAFRGKVVPPTAGTKYRTTKDFRTSKQIRDAKQKEELEKGDGEKQAK